ncbi:MAG: YjbQ family protein [Elusimicrobia bacterium]|nr:YjbQ family protein [Elusimicrobiota bacterium]
MIRINIKTSTKEEIKDITRLIEEAAEKESISDGIIFIHCPHTTCALGINENADYTVKKDILMSYEDIVKNNLPYKHLEGNSTAHIKTLMTGVSLNIFVEKGQIILGTWQGIYLCEFDGPRNREVWIKAIKSK